MKDTKSVTSHQLNLCRAKERPRYAATTQLNEYNETMHLRKDKGYMLVHILLEVAN